jgi:hypothetical protein
VGILWRIYSRKEHMLAFIRHSHGSPFLLQQWSLHGSSTYLFRHRITSDTRSEVFANHVTTVAIPTADKGSLQLNVFWVSKGYAARNNSAPQFQRKKLFWRRAVSEFVVPLREKNQQQGSLFHVCGAPNPSDRLHL